MPEETISFSRRADGWNSFHSWKPDCMVGLNSSLYTWKDGSLWKHNTHSEYNNYYGFNSVSNPTIVTTVFNQEPNEQKVFKTVELESTAAWDVDITTDSTDGIVDNTWFTEKEGGYFAYIRRDENDTDYNSLSFQGVGTMESYSSLVLTFGYIIGAAVTVGDKLYRQIAGSLEFIGNVTAVTSTTITVDAAAVTPVDGVDKIAVAKNTQAESHGVRGHHMTLQLTSDSSTVIELFAAGTDMFKSNP